MTKSISILEQRFSVPGAIIAAFREWILARRYGPGDRLPTIDELAREFGTSKSSVREAVRALQVLGLVDVRHGNGVYVAASDTSAVSMPLTWGLLLTLQTRRELLEVRQVLEVEAAALAAQRAGLEDHRVLSAAIDQLRAAQDSEKAAAADLDFHVAITRAASNRVLLRLLQGIHDLLKQAFRDALSSPGIRDQAAEYHRMILEGIIAGDGARAQNAMRAHLTFVADAWMKESPPAKR